MWDVKQSWERLGLCGKSVWRLWMCEFLSSGGNRNLLLWLFFDKMFFVFLSVEACPVFYVGLSAVLVGSKTLLNSTLDLVDSIDRWE